MKILSSTEVPKNLSPEEGDWFYNGLDCMATLRAWERMQSQESIHSKISYEFVSAMRAPALEMMLRGIRINMEQRSQFIQMYREQELQLKENLNELAFAVWDKGLNPASPKQMNDFFYTCMRLPVQYKFSAGERRPTTDREALEKLKFHFYAQPIINTVLALREIAKKLQFLQGGIDDDTRVRTSFNVTGTETGRWSSSENPFGGGGNQQNITNELRKMFIADPGRKLGYFDLDQAESRAVAYISGDEAYINACNSGDLHTLVCKMVWKDLPWTGNLNEDKEIAEQPFYRHFSYRDMAKRGGHGTNYYGSARTMAKHLKVPEELIVNFQAAYFKAFPGIRKWHQRVATQIQTKGYIISALGRKRYFMGRRFDDDTLREAIAHEPQSTVGEILNLFLHRVWQNAPYAECLAQIHDAILIQYDEKLEDEIVPKILSLGKVQVQYPAGIMEIPNSCETGWNWAKIDPKKKDHADGNPYGMKKYKNHDDRTPPVYKGILDWQVC